MRVEHSARLKKRCVNRVRAGHAICAVARDEGLRSSTVWRWCYAEDVRAIRKWGAPERKHKLCKKLEIIALITGGAKINTVAREHDVAVRTIRSWVKAA